ncbi:MAG: energy transducer TonB [Bdellovibrionaceae bacterium]|nr:energy transducer TonB [Pseudobdellovibrionaceae bacterium]
MKPAVPKAKPVVSDETAPALPKEDRAIDTVAQTSEESGPSGSAGASEVYGTANGIEVSAQERYRIELQAMLEKKKQYPLLAKRLRQQGKVLVKFTLRRDGSVAAAELVSTSEFETLNKAARELISQISGLKPFPDEVKKQQWVFVLPVEYRM